MRKLYLCSGSPRRKELLEQMGLEFQVVVSHAPEEVDSSLTPQEVVQALSQLKAVEVQKNVGKGIFISGDTIVVLENEILGKPKDKEDAFIMLSRLSGKQHFVYTGITVLDGDTGISKSTSVCTAVQMKTLSNETIVSYIETLEPMDKAGAYGIQGYGALLVESINGDYNNVVGLPISTLYELLKEFDIPTKIL